MLGVLLGTADFPATAAGYGQLLGWASRFGVVRQAGVEGTGSYEAALSRHLHAAGIEVIEVNQPDKATRRRRGKTDAIDAQMANRALHTIILTRLRCSERTKSYVEQRISAGKKRKEAIRCLKRYAARESRTMTGVFVRVAQRLLALAAAIWHNWLTDQPIKRSLTAYDH